MLGPICDIRMGDRCFQFLNVETTYKRAEHFCEQQMDHLAHLTSDMYDHLQNPNTWGSIPKTTFWHAANLNDVQWRWVNRKNTFIKYVVYE